MLSYIIDGNNLIGKIHSLMNLQKKDKQASREKLLHLLDRYFESKKANVTLHLDGYQSEKINSIKVKIFYSDSSPADDLIKNQISKSKSTRSTILITSDSNLQQFAKVCSVSIISSENFSKELLKNNLSNDEESKIKQINNIDDFKKLFGV